MSSNIYENLPLTSLSRENKENIQTDKDEVSSANKIKTIQNSLNTSQNSANNSSGVQKTKFQNNIPRTKLKVSKSIADIFFKNTKRIKNNDNHQNILKETSSGNEFVSEITTDDPQLVVDTCDDDYIKPSESVEDDKKVCQKSGNQHSTSTSTFDDGYESCNSTPLGSGEKIYFILYKKRCESDYSIAEYIKPF